MNGVRNIRMMELNQHIICALCGGYFIDATTIIECLHSFCRSCIVRYLECSKYCPICDVQVHKTKPTVNIRADKTLQDLVYRLVPGLFKDEMKRRREFFAKHPQAGASSTSVNLSEERGEVETRSVPSRDDEKISLCLQHSCCMPPYRNENVFGAQNDEIEKVNDRRYLLCPAEITVGHLKKFLRLKFDLQPQFQVEMFHSDEALKDDYTLLDVACIYGWRRQAPLKLFYIVYDRTTTTLNLPSPSKQTLRVPQRRKPGKPRVKVKDKTSPTSSNKRKPGRRKSGDTRRVKKDTKGIKRSKKAKPKVEDGADGASKEPSSDPPQENANLSDARVSEEPEVGSESVEKPVVEEAVGNSSEIKERKDGELAEGTTETDQKDVNESSEDRALPSCAPMNGDKKDKRGDRENHSKDINDNHGGKGANSGDDVTDPGGRALPQSVANGEQSGVPNGAQNGVQNGLPKPCQKLVVNGDSAPRAAAPQHVPGAKRLSPGHNGALSHIESLVNSMKMSRERHESVNGSGGESSPESRRDGSLENGSKSRKRKQAQPLKHQRHKNGIMTSPCPGKLPKTDSLVVDDPRLINNSPVNGQHNGLTPCHHGNVALQKEATKTPANILANGLDKPLELTVKKKRSRDREREPRDRTQLKPSALRS